MVKVELKKQLFDFRMQEGRELIGIPSAVQPKQDLRSLGVMEMVDSWIVAIGSKEEEVLLGVQRSLHSTEDLKW